MFHNHQQIIASPRIDYLLRVSRTVLCGAVLCAILAPGLTLGGCIDHSSMSDGTAYDSQKNSTANNGDGGESNNSADNSDFDDCDIWLTLMSDTVVPTSSEHIIDADTIPKICWTLPDNDKEEPAQDGSVGSEESEEPQYDLSLFVQRGEQIGGAYYEWYIVDGIPSAQRHIIYGNCPPGEVTCSEAVFLYPGQYIITLVDDVDYPTIGALTTFNVE